MSLDITFSDHHYSEDTLKAFGEVIRAIHRVCNDDQLCFWSFIAYVSANHPDILNVTLAPEEAARCNDVLAHASPVRVTIKESEEAKWMREHGNESAD